MNNVEPTVFVVDDDEVVCQSLSFLIEDVGLNVQTYGAAQDFLDAYDPGQPGCLVVDVRMPGMSGLELQSRLAEQGIGLPVIVITGHADVLMAVDAMKAGAVDFIEKPFRDQILLDVIQKALELDARARERRASQNAVESRLARLTPREREVLNHVRAGEHNRVIAEKLGLSQKTVEVHRSSIMIKLDAGSVVELIAMVNTAEAIR